MFKNYLVALFWILIVPVILPAQGFDTTKIDEVLGRPGQKSGDVYRVGFPRTDLHANTVAQRSQLLGSSQSP